MTKTILGIDIGYDQLKLALVRGNRVLKTATAQMPEHLVREGRITSRETMSELIRSTMKENGIHARYAAFVLPNEAVFVKNVEMPEMSIEQLEYNLPFEFNDYITGELKDYVFDYAVVSDPQETADNEDPLQEQHNSEGSLNGADEPAGAVMKLMAVGTLREVLEDAHDILRKAGLRLILTAPALCSYISLLRAQKETLSQVTDEFGILDLGHAAIRMYMFHGDRHVATRVLEIGLSSLDNVLADVYGVDIHLAHTYLMTNYENCQEKEECMRAYENIAVELMRALNFYRFSNPDSHMTDMWLCGGGAVIPPLTGTISDMLSITLHSADELVPGGEALSECNSYVQAIGITMG